MRSDLNMVKEIRVHLDDEAYKNAIERDLGLLESNGKYKCWLHNDKNPSMGYDKERKRFHCFACNGTYDIFDHYVAFYGLGFYDACLKIIDDYNLPIMVKAKEKPKNPPKKHGELKSKAIEYMHKRGFSDKTINDMPLREDNGDIIFEYYNAYGVHEANKRRPARKVSKDEDKMWWEKGCSTDTLFNMHRCVPTRPLIITEGEFDTMAVYEAGYTNVVSVKAGAGSHSWIDACWEWLEQFKEIWLWYDADEKGVEGVRTISKRLSKCTKVIKSKGGKDANEILLKHGKEAVLKCIDNAQALSVDGVLSVADIEEFNVYEATKIKTGIKPLDVCTHGMIAGTLNIITGYSGGGKSTLVNQMCIAEPISQGQKVFVYSGELTHANLKYWLYSTIANEDDLARKKMADGSEYVKLKRFGADKITEWMNEKLYIYEKEEATDSELLSTMEKLAMRKGVKVFVLDNLMMIDIGTGKQEYQEQKVFIKKLKAFAKKYDAWVHLVAHPRKPQINGQKLNKFDVSGSADITNLADYVIGVHRTSETEREAWHEQSEKAQKNNKQFNEPKPKDACIMLFKDRPTGTGEKEANLYFDKDRRRFYISESELSFDYGYAREAVQEDLGDMPF